MECSPLAVAKQRIKVGSPLPFNIRHADGTLLLARGQVIHTEEQLEILMERGALVDAEELRSSVRSEVMDAPIERLPGLWHESVDRIGRTLKSTIATDFQTSLEATARPILALVDRDPDLAIFQVLRQEGIGKQQHYGVSHSVHAAIASILVAQRLGWDAGNKMRIFKAALTMNLSMLELQARLATQVTAPTQGQREMINDHPMRSRQMLEASGVTDKDWLDGVSQHHEIPGGSGYPNKLAQVGEIADLLRRVDIYTAKLAARVSRTALPANEAGRSIFLQDQGHPMATAIIKEFGVYPPGCFVKLASGEAGVVVKRGANANTPLVAALTNRDGHALIEPVRRNTAVKEHAIVGIISEKSIKVRVSPEKLVVLASG
jgi:HD-GYP domain-containing protein (c-di-GMP phosphodiesterase class II)